MIEILFVGGAYLEESPNLSAQVCQNFTVEVDGYGGKQVLSLIGTEGLSSYMNIGTSGKYMVSIDGKLNSSGEAAS